jgi:transcriptional regulator with XRE-family HTH domain
MNFSEKLKHLRKQFQFSQEQLAEKIGVSRQAITKWETDGGLPDIENLMAIAALFSVSMDELLSAEKTVRSSKDYSYESVTELDIRGAHRFDLHSCGANSVTVGVTDSEKLRVRLASNVLKNLASDFKVQLDEHKNRMDVDIRRVGGSSENDAKAALSVLLQFPAALCEEAELSVAAETLILDRLSFPLELDGKVSRVSLTGVSGAVSLNSGMDMLITCDGLPSRLEVSQISAASTLHIPEGETFFTKIKGKSNQIIYTRNGKPAEAFDAAEASKCVELAGMNAELIIDIAGGVQ